MTAAPLFLLPDMFSAFGVGASVLSCKDYFKVYMRGLLELFVTFSQNPAISENFVVAGLKWSRPQWVSNGAGLNGEHFVVASLNSGNRSITCYASVLLFDACRAALRQQWGRGRHHRLKGVSLKVFACVCASVCCICCYCESSCTETRRLRVS